MTIFQIEKKLKKQAKVIQSCVERNCLLIWYEGDNFLEVCVDKFGVIRNTDTGEELHIEQLKEKLS